MAGKDRMEAFLREHGMSFEERHHPRYFTAQEVAASEHVSGRRFGKAVMVMAEGKPVTLVLPAQRQVDLRKAATALGVKDIRLATSDELVRAFPDCEEGAVSPFGNLYNLPVWVDASLARQKDIVLEAGTHSETLDVHYVDFERSVHPAVAELSRAEEPHHARAR